MCEYPLAKTECIVRHDKDCTHLHYSVCEKLGIEIARNCRKLADTLNMKI